MIELSIHELVAKLNISYFSGSYLLLLLINTSIFATNSYSLYPCNRCRRHLIIQTLNSVWSNNLSLKYQSFTPSSRKDIRTQHFSVKQITNLQNFKYLMQFQVIKQKMCKKKKCENCDKLYIFVKPLPWRIQICKNICKIFKN